MLIRAVVCALCLLLFSPALGLAAVGDRDPAFNGGRPVIVDPSGEGTYVQTELNDVIVDGFGRTVAGGRLTLGSLVDNPGAIVRLRPDGSYDPAFGGGDGLLLPRYREFGYSTELHGLQRDPQGRLGAGFVAPSDTEPRVGSVRYLDSGAEDDTFGTNGIAAFDPTPDKDEILQTVRAAAGSDGSVTFAQRTYVFPETIRLLRVTGDGHLDTGFGTGGRVTLSQAETKFEELRDAAVYPDGRVLLVGTSFDASYAWLVVRLTAAGALDPTFDGDGVLRLQAGTAPFLRDGTDVAIGAGGAIYVTGGAAGALAVAKLTAAGQVDTTFGIARSTIAEITPGLAGRLDATSLAVQADGRVLVAGVQQPSDGSVPRLVIARYTTAGKLDTTFAGDGAITDTVGPTSRGAVPAQIVLTPDGQKLVVAGQTDTDSSFPRSFGFVARYVVAPPPATPPPANTERPGLTGVPVPGQTLTCVPGTWTGSPRIDVVFERAPRSATGDNDPGWGAIAGTTGNRYVLTQADLGSRVRCREVATNAGGSATAPSVSKRVDTGVPVLVRTPAVTGIPVGGQRLTCDAGEWSNGPDLTVAWLRDDTPIPSITARTYTLSGDDARHRVGCRVSAANDVGPAAAPAASNTLLVVSRPPTNTRRPISALGVTGPKPTDAVVTCEPGQWDEDYGEYEFRWQREGAEIAGETGMNHTVTVDDLGRNLTCESFSTNPAGRSEGAVSNPVLVPLPAADPGPPGRVFQAGGFNALDPTNMLAVSGDYLAVIGELSLAHMRSELLTVRGSYCRSSFGNDEPQLEFSRALERAQRGRQIYGYGICGVLNYYPAEQIRVTLDGLFWLGGACSVPGDPATSGPTCPRAVGLINPLDPARPPTFSMDEQARLAAVQPLRTLWDFDSDGHVDASCDADAPILRSLYSRGIYRPRAVVIAANSAQTGNYAVIDHTLVAHPRSGDQRGQVRAAQPFACRTAIDPPPEPQLPCTSEATIGRIHIQGNLCPISMRQIPAGELAALPDDVQAVLERQALTAPVRRRAFASASSASFSGLRAAPGSLAYDAAVNISALSTLPDTREATVPQAWAKRLEGIGHYDREAAQFAMDQIYIARGTAKLNGVDVDPRNGSALVMVPSDAGGAIDTVTRMTLSAKDVGMSLGSVPIGDPGKLTADLADRAGVAPPTLREANLDQLADSLKSKLNLGPFKLVGDTKLRLADDGSAFLDAHAELPSLLGGPGGSPIRTSVTVRADRGGAVRLEGVHLEVGAAYLAALKIKNLRLDYGGGGLDVQGQLLFPPVDAGIAINRFRLGPSGQFQELDVDYLAGAGQGIPVGPGIFMTKLGGGLSLDPDEVRGRATFSVGPSTGGGCPTAGIEAGFVIHFAPVPFFVKATGQVQLLCIPIVDTAFYADATGLVDLSANMHFDAGPVYFTAGLHGALQLPRWQIDLRGEGGIRHLISAQIKAILGNLGAAGCGRVKLLFITLAAGAGVRFTNGRPPLSLAELANNLRLFTGCDLTSYSPFGRDVRMAGDGARVFSLPDPAPKLVALEVVGAGGPPSVRLRAPDGTVLDATGLREDLTEIGGVAGLRDPAFQRTLIFVRGQAGSWRIEPAEGSPAIVDLQHADIVPQPQIKAEVGGAGAARVLTYSVADIPDQQVRFVEHSELGQRVIKTVKEGGSGTASFLTSEGRGTARTIVAEVVQDGLPRDNITVARFDAPRPSPGRPPRVRIRRKGSKATVTWGKAVYASSYEVVVSTGDGSRRLLDPPGNARSVSFRGLGKREGATASVVAISPAGHRSRPGVGRLRVARKPHRRPR